MNFTLLGVSSTFTSAAGVSTKMLVLTGRLMKILSREGRNGERGFPSYLKKQGATGFLPSQNNERM